MEIIYIVVYCSGLGMTTELFEILDEAKNFIRSIKEGPLARLNHFVPIQIATGKNEILKAVQNYIDREFEMGACFLQGEFHEWYDYCDAIMAYIAAKQPGWKYLKEKYHKLYTTNKFSRLDVNYQEWDFMVITDNNKIEIQGIAGWNYDQQVPEYGVFGKSDKSIMDAYYQAYEEIESIEDDNLRRSAYIALKELMFTYLDENYTPKDKVVTDVIHHRCNWTEYYYA